MKKIGLLGGMSSVSTIDYYNRINTIINKKFGGHVSAEILLYSVNFDIVFHCMHDGNWERLAKILIDAAKRLELAGADLIAIACNSAHKVAETIRASVNIPFIHILDPVGAAIKEKKLTGPIGVLGNRFTMEDGFYTDYLKNKFNVDCITPSLFERRLIHDLIYKELCHSKITKASKNCVKKIVNNLKERGAEGVILGCTELPLLFNKLDTEVLLFDTTKLHATAIANYALYSENVAENLINIGNKLWTG